MRCVVNRLSTGRGVVDSRTESGDGRGVLWEERLLAMFDDLEQQAEGLALTARDAEVAELGRAEYAQVELAARLHGSAGERVGLAVIGIGRMEATLVRAGPDWCLVDDGAHEWLVRLPAVLRVRGLGERAVDARHRSIGARLSFGSVLRGVAEEGAPVLVHLLDGETERAVVRRVGADFLEVVERPEDAWVGAGSAHPEAVAFAAVAAVRRS